MLFNSSKLIRKLTYQACISPALYGKRTENLPYEDSTGKHTASQKVRVAILTMINIMDYENPSLAPIIEMIERKFDELKFMQKPFMTVDELSIYLGLSPQYIRKMTHNREIPYFKPNGKKLYFDKEEIDQWVFKSRVATNEELLEDARQRLKKK